METLSVVTILGVLYILNNAKKGIDEPWLCKIIKKIGIITVILDCISTIYQVTILELHIIQRIVTAIIGIGILVFEMYIIENLEKLQKRYLRQYKEMNFEKNIIQNQNDTYE